MVKINLPTVFPVYGPPTASIKGIWSIVRRLDPEDFTRSAVLFHPETGQAFKVGRKIAKTDPVAGLLKARLI